jgi:putative oxidoreductase
LTNFARQSLIIYMKIFIIILRVLMGALFAFSSLAFFFNLMPQQAMEGNAKLFIEGLFASGYLMMLVKVLELSVGIALLVNRFVPLALVIIFPITVNIFLFHLFLAPDNLVVPGFLLFANLFLAYKHRESYKPILAIR